MIRNLLQVREIYWFPSNGLHGIDLDHFHARVAARVERFLGRLTNGGVQSREGYGFPGSWAQWVSGNIFISPTRKRQNLTSVVIEIFKEFAIRPSMMFYELRRKRVSNKLRYEIAAFRQFEFV